MLHVRGSSYQFTLSRGKHQRRALGFARDEVIGLRRNAFCATHMHLPAVQGSALRNILTTQTMTLNKIHDEEV